MRTDGNGRAGTVERVGVAALQRPVQHVDKAGGRVRRPGLPRHHVHHPLGSAHMSAAPMMFSFPGMHTHWFVPVRKTVILPSAPISVTVASRVMTSGPERSARRIFAFTISSDMGTSPFIWFTALAWGATPTLVLAPAQPVPDDRLQVARPAP